MDINTDQPFKALKAQIMEYIELKTELARLSLIEFVAKVAFLIFAAMVGIIILSFVFIALSFFIGIWLHSYGLGFLISAAFYLLLLWCSATIGRRQVQNYMIKKIMEQTNPNKE